MTGVSIGTFDLRNPHTSVRRIGHDSPAGTTYRIHNARIENSAYVDATVCFTRNVGYWECIRCGTAGVGEHASLTLEAVEDVHLKIAEDGAQYRAFGFFWRADEREDFTPLRVVCVDSFSVSELLPSSAVPRGHFARIHHAGVPGGINTEAIGSVEIHLDEPGNAWREIPSGTSADVYTQGRPVFLRLYHNDNLPLPGPTVVWCEAIPLARPK